MPVTARRVLSKGLVGGRRLELASTLVVLVLGLAARPCPVQAVVDLSNWMGDLMPVIGNFTVLDLSLPGTHDTLSVALDDVVGDDAEDIPLWLSEVLHLIKDFADVGDFIRNQSITQGLNVTSQLDSGVRFIDFRIVFSQSPNGSFVKDWFGLHFAQTLDPAAVYLEYIRAWLDAHPSEVLVFWFSKHGDPCHTVFDNAKPADMYAFWAKVESIFSGLLFDTRSSSTNTTSIAELVKSNQRVIIYTSPGNFSGGSPHALDGCTIDNQCPTGGNIWKSLDGVHSLLDNATVVRAIDKANNSLFLLSLAGYTGQSQLKYAALLRYFPIDYNATYAACVKAMGWAPTADFCPMHLMDASLLGNFYQQTSLESAVNGLHPGRDLPGAIYIDAVDVNGTIRTGVSLFGPHYQPGTVGAGSRDFEQGCGPYDCTRYAYVPTVLLSTVRRVCKTQASNPACHTLEDSLQAMRAVYPVTLWDDPAHARFTNWPNNTNA